jgi:hypothetical protein
VPKAAPFQRYNCRCDEWYDRHAIAYQSELLTVRAQLTWQGLGFAVGVGTGRFAGPLGVRIRIDSAREVLDYVARRTAIAVAAVANELG